MYRTGELAQDPVRPGAIIWVRWSGVVLPALVNYGFLLSNDDRPHWAALLASALILCGSTAYLALRRDWSGAIWVTVLFLVISAWPIVLNIIGPLGD